MATWQASKGEGREKDERTKRRGIGPALLFIVSLLRPATQASQGKILGPNRFEPRISDVPGREEGTALIIELWTGLWGVKLFTRFI